MAKIEFDIPYVLARGRAYRYRRIVPLWIADKIGRKNWIKTWKRGTPIDVVKFEAATLAAQHDYEIKVAESGQIESTAREWLDGDKSELHRRLARIAEFEKEHGSHGLAPIVKAIEAGGTLPVESPLMSLALAQDIERYGQERDNYPFESSVKSFVALIGDKPITTISRAEANAWITSLRDKEYRPATLRKRVGNLRGLINRAFLDLEYAGLNPFSRHQLKGNGAVTDRLPFNSEMLALIDSYLAKSKRLKPETRHILQIMRNTGASPKEIGGLVLADISLNGGEIPFMWVRVNAQRGIKAAARDRQIPLVGVSLSAVKEAVEHAKARTTGEPSDTAKLFAGFGGKTGQDAKLISKNINKALIVAGIKKSPRLSAYSYRHTLAEALRSAGTLNHVQDRIMGHTVPGMAGRYGASRGLLGTARDALVAAMEHLGDVDDSIFSEAERL